MRLLMQCRCPECGRVSKIPVDAAVSCYFCGNMLGVSGEGTGKPFAEPPQKPRVNLEKAPRVRLEKTAEAAPALALPKRFPKSRPIIPKKAPRKPLPGWVVEERSKFRVLYLSDIIRLLIQFLFVLMMTAAGGEWISEIAITVMIVMVFVLPFQCISALMRSTALQARGRSWFVTAAAVPACFLLDAGLTSLTFLGGSAVGMLIYNAK